MHDICEGISMRITSDQKREIIAAYQQGGLGKDLGKQVVKMSPPEVLHHVLKQIREGGPLPVPDSRGAGRPLGVDKFNAVAESVQLSPIEDDLPTPPKSESKNVLFSFKVGSADLDVLRQLSERDGESVAVLMRQAIRDYLVVRGVRK